MTVEEETITAPCVGLVANCTKRGGRVFKGSLGVRGQVMG